MKLLAEIIVALFKVVFLIPLSFVYLLSADKFREWGPEGYAWRHGPTKPGKKEWMPEAPPATLPYRRKKSS